MTQDNTNPVTKQKKLKVSITRTYGKVTVEYGIEEIFDLSTALEQKEAYAKLRAICEFEHAQHIEDFKRAPLSYGQAADAPPNSNPTNGAITEKVLEITLDIEGGKKKYKVKTPSNPKWGVPIYEDMSGFETVKTLLGTEFSVKPERYTVTHVPQGAGRKAVAIEAGF